MSFNRTKYDNCSYKEDLKTSVDTLSHILAPYRYEHKDKCMHKLGFVGGTAVSHIQGDLVDLESELRGQTRFISRCSANQYRPSNDNMITNDKTEPINTNMTNLPSCQAIMYRSVPLPPPIQINNC
jgi:hypothetical protein